MSRTLRFAAALLPLGLAVTGCGLVLGIDDFTDAPSTGGGGTAGAGGGGSGGTSMGGGGSGGTTTSGGGGEGGTTTSTLCTAGTKMPCYDGPPKTENVGPCKGGVSVCQEGGQAWGPCQEQVLPAAEESCLTPGFDDNCDGVVGEAAGCCPPNEPMSCYTGPPGTAGKGQCQAGTFVCPADGVLPQGCPGQVLPADEFCATTQDEDCNGQNCWVWTQTKGGTALEYASALSTNFNKRIVIGGAFQNTINLGGDAIQPFDEGTPDIFLAAYGPDGTHLWSKGLGRDANEAVYDASFGSGVAIVGYYLFGDTDLGGGPLGVAEGIDGFFARYDDNGAHLSSRRIGGPGTQHVYAVSQVTDGILIAGDFDANGVHLGEGGTGATLASMGGNDVFVAKYSKMDGSLIWGLDIGGSGADATWATNGTLDGDFVSGVAYVTGKTAGGLSIGSMTLTGAANFFVAKINANGSPGWLKGFSVAGSSFHVASTMQGPYLAGTANGTVIFDTALTSTENDIVVVRLDANGNVQWSKLFGGAGSQQLVSLAADNAGAVIAGIYDTAFTIGGTALPSPSVPQGGGFVARLDTAGEVVWVHPMGAPADVTLDTDGFTVMSGGFDGIAHFGGGAVTSAGSSDIFLGKLGK